MNVNTNKKVSFYTQGQRWAARVLCILWLFGSGSPEGTLAAPKRQSAIATPGPVAEGVTKGSSSQHPTLSDLEQLIDQADNLDNQKFGQGLKAIIWQIFPSDVHLQIVVTNLGAIALTMLLVQDTYQISHEQVTTIAGSTLSPEILVKTGLLQEIAPKLYEFPHGRIQAYFAGCTLAQQFLSGTLEASLLPDAPWYNQISSFMAMEVINIAEIDDVKEQLLRLFREKQKGVDLPPNLLLQLQVVHEWLCKADKQDVEDVMNVLEENASQVMASLEQWFCKVLEQVRYEVYDSENPGSQLSLLIDSLQGFRSTLWQTAEIRTLLQQTAENSREEVHVRAAAFYALARIMSESPDGSGDLLDPISENPTEKILQILQQAATDQNWYVFQTLVDALGKAILASPEKSEAMLDILIATTQEKAGYARQKAVEILGEIIAAVPSKLEEILSTLQEAVARDEESNVRQKAVEVLGEIIAAVPSKLEEILPTLQEAVQDEESNVRYAAFKALWKSTSVVPDQSGERLATLQKAAKDQEPKVRRLAKLFRKPLKAANAKKRLAPQGGLQLARPLQPGTNQDEQTLPIYQLGKIVWKYFYGDVGEEPALPDNIEHILERPCPFCGEEEVKDTHCLVLIPSHVAGKPLTLDSLETLIKSPQNNGYGTSYGDALGSGLAGEDIRSLSPESSYWVLMTRNIIPDSINKSYQGQCKLVKDLTKSTGFAYTVPSVLEVTVMMALHYVRTGEALFDLFTRCCDTNCYDTNHHYAVGNSYSRSIESSRGELNSSIGELSSSIRELNRFQYFSNLRSSDSMTEFASSVSPNFFSIVFYEFLEDYCGESLGVLAAQKF